MTATRLNIALTEDGLCLPATDRILVLRAASAFDYSGLPPENLQLVNSFRPEFDRLTRQGYTVTAQPDGIYAAALVHLTRSKQETLALIAQAFLSTRPGGVIVVDGAKTDGIESALKHCKSLFDINGLTVKSHGKLFWMTRPETLPGQIDDWLAALTAKPNLDGFLTAPGMFSMDRVDVGSAMLARHFDARLKGLVADLGAGWGWLSAQALDLGDITRIDLFEAEKTALDAARANIRDARAGFHWADVTTLDPNPIYDAIISNPPFHQGRAAEPSLGLAFIEQAADLLKPKGLFWLVANRQLPYEAGLDRCFGHWTSLEETQHFKAILATKPRTAAARRKLSNPTRPRKAS